MSDNSFKPWQLPLSAEAKARAISHINERHEMLLAVGPVAFAKMGRQDKERYAHINCSTMATTPSSTPSQCPTSVSRWRTSRTGTDPRHQGS